jgi:hypothetical protein
MRAAQSLIFPHSPQPPHPARRWWGREAGGPPSPLEQSAKTGILTGDKRVQNKRIVEALANECYWMELRGEPEQRVWAYRKAAWAI